MGGGQITEIEARKSSKISIGWSIQSESNVLQAIFRDNRWGQEEEQGRLDIAFQNQEIKEDTIL